MHGPHDHDDDRAAGGSREVRDHRHRRYAESHRHGLVDETVKRSRDGIRAVVWSLCVLGGAAVAQTIVFVASGSVALLADVVHNGGDALTAIPLAIAFSLRSATAERRAGLVVVAAVLISACVAGVESVDRLVHPSTPSHLPVLVVAGALGFVGNWLADCPETRELRATSRSEMVVPVSAKASLMRSRAPRA